MNTKSEDQPAQNPEPHLKVMETILVVDDDPDLRLLASLLLQRCGYRVLTANNGEHAKAIAQANPDIDLLLTDVEMPVMMGDELAEWFRVTRSRTAVVFMSGNPTQYRRLDASYFVEKPFIRFDQLVETVREALDHQHATQLPATTAA